MTSSFGLPAAASRRVGWQTWTQSSRCSRAKSRHLRARCENDLYERALPPRPQAAHGFPPRALLTARAPRAHAGRHRTGSRQRGREGARSRRRPRCKALALRVCRLLPCSLHVVCMMSARADRSRQGRRERSAGNNCRCRRPEACSGGIRLGSGVHSLSCVRT